MNDWQPTYDPKGMDREAYQGEGELFWIDTTHLYFRFNWHSWYRVASDNAEHCAVICRHHTVTLALVSSNTTLRHPLRVCQIRALPSELFGDEPGQTA